MIIVFIILSKWTEYCGDNAFLDCNQPQDEDIQPTLHGEVEIAPKTEKSSEVDNIPAELIIYQQNFFKLVDKP